MDVFLAGVFRVDRARVRVVPATGVSVEATAGTDVATTAGGGTGDGTADADDAVDGVAAGTGVGGRLATTFKTFVASAMKLAACLSVFTRVARIVIAPAPRVMATTCSS